MAQDSKRQTLDVGNDRGLRDRRPENRRPSWFAAIYLAKLPDASSLEFSLLPEFVCINSLDTFFAVGLILQKLYFYNLLIINNLYLFCLSLILVFFA